MGEARTRQRQRAPFRAAKGGASCRDGGQRGGGGGAPGGGGRAPSRTAHAPDDEDELADRQISRDQKLRLVDVWDVGLARPLNDPAGEDEVGDARGSQRARTLAHTGIRPGNFSRIRFASAARFSNGWVLLKDIPGTYAARSNAELKCCVAWSYEPRAAPPQKQCSKRWEQHRTRSVNAVRVL